MKEVLDHIIRSPATQWPAKTAIIDDGESFTFSELYSAIYELKQHLLQFGITPGMGVGVLGESGVQYFISGMAVMLAEAVFVPIDGRMTDAERDAMLARTPIAAMIHTKHPAPQGDSIVDLGKTGNFVVSLIVPKGKNPFCLQLPDAAFMRYTSGTTGSQKGVLLTAKTILERIAATRDGIGLKPEDRILCVLPMAYHFIASILTYWWTGCTMVLHTGMDGDRIIDIINRYKTTVLYGSPVQYRMLLNARLKESIPSIRLAITTTAGIDPSTAKAFRMRFGIPITQVYGIIELGLPLINLHCADSNPVAVGHPAPGFEVSILINDGQKVNPGTAGELAIRGPGMFDGYYDPFTPVDTILCQNYFLTGDIAVSNSEGCITILGRIKSVINVGGNKVFPEEVEAVLLQFPGIKKCRVSGSPHPILGEIVIATYIPEFNAMPIDEDALYLHCRQMLTPYKVPTRFMVTEMISETGSGKIIR